MAADLEVGITSPGPRKAVSSVGSNAGVSDAHGVHVCFARSRLAGPVCSLSKEGRVKLRYAAWTANDAMASGRMTSEAALICGHGEAADGGFDAASRAGSAGRRNQSGRWRGVEGGVSDRLLRNVQIMAFGFRQGPYRVHPVLCLWNE